MRKSNLAVVGLGLLLFAGRAGSTDRYVVPVGTAGITSGVPYNAWTNAATSIVTAVSAASAPETVWVSNGTYYPRATITITKGITVRSLPEYGAALTIVDEEYPAYTNRAFDLGHAQVVVDGFTIKGGWGSSSDGGGARITADGGTIQNCIITSNTCGTGAGLYIYGSNAAAYVRNCTIVSNRAGTGGGMRIANTNNYVLGCMIISNTVSSSIGGIWISAGSAVISNCDIMYNESATLVGGIFTAGSVKILASRIVGNRALNGYGGGCACVTIEDSVVASNYCSTYGGGLYNSRAYRCTIKANSAGLGGGIYFTSPAGVGVSNSIICNNVATNGGGVYCDGVGTLQNCQIYNNVATNKGSGIYCGSGGTLKDCLVYNNNSASNAGGIYINNLGINNGAVASCTIVSNYAANIGGGVHVVTTTSNITDSIIYSNAAGSSDPDICCNAVSDRGAFYYCCANFASFTPGQGNKTNNPMFNNAPAGNYRLVTGSPCFNAGTNQDWMTGALDLDDRMRIRYGTVDMGCYEYINPGMIFSGH